MFFQVYGADALAQWGMLIVVLAGLILLNEFARRTKMGGCIMFFVVPLILTAYERLVPLRQTVCGADRLYRLHDDQVQMGHRCQALVQTLPVHHRGHQHSDSRGFGL